MQIILAFWRNLDYTADMLDVILEAQYIFAAAGVLILLWLIGDKARFRRQRGWTVILAGFCLILVGTVIDAAGHTSPTTSSSVGGTSTPALVAAVISYVAGLVLIAIGLILWIPVLTQSQRDQAAIVRSHTELRSRLAESTAECKVLSERLELEIGERKRVEERLSAVAEGSQRREKEVSALLLAACGVLEHKSFLHNARALFVACRNLTGGTAGYIALSSSSGEQVNVLLLDTGDGPQTADDLPPIPMRGLRGEVYRSGRVAYDNRAGDWDESLLPGVSLSAGNLLFAPLLIKGNIVGLLCIANKPDGFDANDSSLAEAFADLAALGLYNTLLLELVKTSEQRLRAVVETAGGTATADVQGLIVSWNQAVEAIFGGSADHVIEPAEEKKGH